MRNRMLWIAGAAALATILFLGVLPVMYINLRNLRQQGIGT